MLVTMVFLVSTTAVETVWMEEECKQRVGNCSKGCEPGFMGTDCVASNLENFLIIIHYFIHSYANNIHSTHFLICKVLVTVNRDSEM